MLLLLLTTFAAAEQTAAYYDIVGGPAGNAGTVKVSANICLGVQEQKVDDVIIKETKAAALIDDKTPAGQNELILQLDENYSFTKIPTVTVESGDIILDTYNIRTTGTQIEGGQLIIPIKSGSKKTAAVIKVTDIYVSSNRNAPAGPVAIKIVMGACNAVNNTGIFSCKSTAATSIASSSAAPPFENRGVVSGGLAAFKINSNIMQADGLPKVMDAVPYIKNSRIFVPVRFLGYALGLTDSDIVWDSAAQKAVLIKGDTKVELIAGSTTMMVNDEDKAIEVAPELSGGRFMLPARIVVEAFGAKIGWDEDAQSIVIEN